MKSGKPLHCLLDSKLNKKQYVSFQTDTALQRLTEAYLNLPFRLSSLEHKTQRHLEQTALQRVPQWSLLLERQKKNVRCSLKSILSSFRTQFWPRYRPPGVQGFSLRIFRNSAVLLCFVGSISYKSIIPEKLGSSLVSGAELRTCSTYAALVIYILQPVTTSLLFQA